LQEATSPGTPRRVLQVVRDAYDGPEPFSNKRVALDWLKLITDQTFDSPEKWVQWWQKYHSMQPN
jgi:hypothetical protein